MRVFAARSAAADEVTGLVKLPVGHCPKAKSYDPSTIVRKMVVAVWNLCDL